jgi:hypothetical protein
MIREEQSVRGWGWAKRGVGLCGALAMFLMGACGVAPSSDGGPGLGDAAGTDGSVDAGSSADARVTADASASTADASASAVDAGASAVDAGASAVDASASADARVTVDAGGGMDGAVAVADGGGSSGGGSLSGYWVWARRVQGSAVQMGPIDMGQMKLAFGDGNARCHYVWNEITRSDFHTECTFRVEGDMVTFTARADPDGTAAGWSCAHPDWTSWNDRPAVQYGRYRIVGDELWIGVNTYWGFGGGVIGVPQNTSAKRFPFWESLGQARTSESWIVFRRVSRADWYGRYAISTNCQGTPAQCAMLPGCGAGDRRYVD